MRNICVIAYCVIVTRCLETIDVCIWRMFAFMSIVVTGNVCCVAGVVKDSVLSIGVVTYVVCLFA